MTSLVLMAPRVLQLIARWKQILGAALEDWRRTGWREVLDYTTKQPARVDLGFRRTRRRSIGFPDVQVSTLILHGTRDHVVPIRALAKVRRRAREDEHDRGD